MGEFMGNLADAIASDTFRGVMLIIAATIAVTSILASHRTAKKKQAIDVLIQSKKDEMLAAGQRLIAQLHNATDDNIRKYGSADMRGNQDAAKIGYVLNHYEYLAVGIRGDIFDEEILKDATYTTVVNLYDRALPYIDKVRTVNNSDTIFQEFECMACRWKSKPLKKRKP